MNMLSWLIYGAEVLSRLSNFVFTLALVLLFLGVASFIIRVASEAEPSFEERERIRNMTREEKNAENEKAGKDFLGFIKKLAIYMLLPIFLFFVSVLIPSQNTIYLIAASEVAEAGYKSELGEKVQAIVEEKINDILATEKVDK